MGKIKLLLVDDHAVVRTGLGMLLDAQDDMEIIAEAESGDEAIELVQSIQPDIVLMDIQLSGEMNGIVATRRIKEIMPETAVLALTMYEEDQYFFEMLKAGASGYIPKRAAPDSLVTAIRTISRGESYLHPSFTSRLMQDYVKKEESDSSSDSKNNLTPREREILILVAKELTNQEMANKLKISIKTVARHRENIMRKLNLHGRIALVKYAIKKGLISLDES